MHRKGDERSLRMAVFALPILDVGSLSTGCSAALGPWLTALTALQTLDAGGEARCFVLLVWAF